MLTERLFRQIIDGSYLLEDLNAARKRLDDLKRMQHSRLYAHPSAALRQKLNETRRAADQEYTLLKKKLASRSRKLSRLPDTELLVNLGSTWHACNEALREYLEEAEQWFASVEPLTRPVVSTLQERHRAHKVRARTW